MLRFVFLLVVLALAAPALGQKKKKVDNDEERQHMPTNTGYDNDNDDNKQQPWYPPINQYPGQYNGICPPPPPPICPPCNCQGYPQQICPQNNCWPPYYQQPGGYYPGNGLLGSADSQRQQGVQSGPGYNNNNNGPSGSGYNNNNNGPNGLGYNNNNNGPSGSGYGPGYGPNSQAYSQGGPGLDDNKSLWGNSEDDSLGHSDKLVNTQNTG